MRFQFVLVTTAFVAAMYLLSRYHTRVMSAGFQPARTGPDQRLLLRFDWTLLVLAGLLLTFAVALMSLPLWDRRAAKRVLLFLALGSPFLGMAVWVFTVWLAERVILDANGAVAYRAFRQPRAFLWSEVVATSWGRFSQQLRLHLRNGDSVALSPLMNGFRDLCVVLMQATPQSVHQSGLAAAGAAISRLAG